MKYRKLKIVGIILISIFIIFGLFICGLSITRNVIVNKNDFSYLKGKANKIILFIGDGMGENHIKISSTYLEKEAFFTTFKKEGYVSTFSKQIFTPTDSAAAATALATGKKVNNREIAYHNGENIDSIADYAKSLGYGVGIVTTDSLDGATPSAFSANAIDRGNTDEIIRSQLISNVDLFLGAGYGTYLEYKEDFNEKGYVFIDKYSALLQTNKKIIGSFAKINNYTTENDLPTLPLLVDYAIGYFEYNYPNGYFIMVEGAHIDKRSHDNLIFEMIEYFDEFDNAVKSAYDKLAKYDDVCFIVTADHETGNLEYTFDKTKISNELFHSGGHTSKKVKYYFYHKDEMINKVDKTIDNTDIYKICKALISKN